MTQQLQQIAYGFDDKFKKEKNKNILIFDLGAANCNVSIISLEDYLFEVKATNGNII